jgi:hypothetical protein
MNYINDHLLALKQAVGKELSSPDRDRSVGLEMKMEKVLALLYHFPCSILVIFDDDALLPWLEANYIHIGVDSECCNFPRGREMLPCRMSNLVCIHTSITSSYQPIHQCITPSRRIVNQNGCIAIP